jgi:hypothetical protein
MKMANQNQAQAAAAKPKVQWFKNIGTGAEWELTEGTAAYAAADADPKAFTKIEAPKKDAKAEAAK